MVADGEGVGAGGGVDGDLMDVGGGAEVAAVEVPEYLCVRRQVGGFADEGARGAFGLGEAYHGAVGGIEYLQGSGGITKRPWRLDVVGVLLLVVMTVQRWQDEVGAHKSWLGGVGHITQ